MLTYIDDSQRAFWGRADLRGIADCPINVLREHKVKHRDPDRRSARAKRDDGY